MNPKHSFLPVELRHLLRTVHPDLDPEEFLEISGNCIEFSAKVLNHSAPTIEDINIYRDNDPSLQIIRIETNIEQRSAMLIGFQKHSCELYALGEIDIDQLRLRYCAADSELEILDPANRSRGYGLHSVSLNTINLMIKRAIEEGSWKELEPPDFLDEM